jgi:deoxycytidine triphosphate deaminase
VEQDEPPMILTSAAMHEEWRRGRIVIDPFDESQLNPNSYNFRLGDHLRVYTAPPLDPKRENLFEDFTIDADGFLLEPQKLYLANTLEVMGSTRYAPTFAARSSVARLGLFINLSASLGDIGFIGQWTLQLFSIHPLRIYPGMKIGQIMWWTPKGEIDLYCGKYQGSRGPQSTLIYRDFLSDQVVG